MNANNISLDFFRQNDLSYMICQIKQADGCVYLPFIYNDFFFNYMVNFEKKFFEFENARNVPIAYDVNLLSIFTGFFMCFEQFVNTLYQILYFLKLNTEIPGEKEAIKLFRKDYKITISEILEILQVDSRELYKTGIINKIAELEDARNYILHGNIGRIKIKKTQLPAIALTINYEDILEELDIIINFINYFRFIIPNIDLMPSVYILVEEAMFSKKLDVYFYDFLIVWVKAVLNKHNLKPTKAYKLLTKPLECLRETFAEDVLINMKMKPEEQYDFNMNNCLTNLKAEAMSRLISEEEIAAHKGLLQLPKFIIKPQ